jgi:hypothetical protein
MKTKTIKKLVCLFLIFSFSSCIVPETKKSYLQNFGRFVKDVEKNNSKFTKADWKWANRRFSKYSVEWYKKFRDDLKMEEKIQVSVLRTRYLVVKESSITGRSINDDLDMQFEKFSDDIKEYLDKNLDKDIREITKGAKEISDSAVKVVEDVLKGLKKNHPN